MTAVPYSLAVAMFVSGAMQRAAAGRFSGSEFKREELFSRYSSYTCFLLAAFSLAASIFMP